MNGLVDRGTMTQNSEKNLASAKADDEEQAALNAGVELKDKDNKKS